MIVELYFPNKTQTPRLLHLLHLNEIFRYLQPPFPEHWRDYFAELLRDVPVDLGRRSDKIGDKIERGDLLAYFERWARLLDYPVVIYLKPRKP